MKRVAITAALLASLVGMSACKTTDTNDTPGENVVYVEVPRDNGDDVPCVIYDSDNYAGGLSCDWESYHGLTEKPVE